MWGGRGDSAAVGNGGKTSTDKRQQRGEGAQHCAHPTSLNQPGPGQTGLPAPGPPLPPI